MTLRSRFASSVYHARIKLGLTQEEAAEALDISTRWYQEIETGKALPSTMLTLKIFAFFEIDGKLLKEDVYASV